MGLEAFIAANAVNIATGVTVGLGAATATTQIMAGRQAAKSATRQGEFNAQVMEQQGSMVEAQKKVEEYQYNRQIARAKGAIIARTGKAGLGFSGSPIALLIDTETQMQYDKAIGQYNLEVDRRRAISGADYYRFTGQEQARAARFTGYSNAFSTALGTAASVYSIRSGKL